MSSLQMSPSKAAFISVTALLVSSISFWFFLRVSISLLAVPMPTSAVRALSISIIVVFNSGLIVPTSLLCLSLVWMLALSSNWVFAFDAARTNSFS